MTYVNITVVDVGSKQAGFGGVYSACVRTLRKVLGKDRVRGAYGSGYPMDQGMYVLGTVKEVKTALGQLVGKVTVKKANHVKRWCAKGTFGLPRQPLKY